MQSQRRLVIAELSFPTSIISATIIRVTELIELDLYSDQYRLLRRILCYLKVLPVSAHEGVQLGVREIMSFELQEKSVNIINVHYCVN